MILRESAYFSSPIKFSFKSLHIFAQKGRSIHRPNGRADWLLFYVAKGCERFTLNTQMDANEGSFVIFRPGKVQEHIYIGDKTREFYYVHFNAPYEFDLFGLQSSVIYNTKPSTKICDLFEEIINEIGANVGFSSPSYFCDAFKKKQVYLLQRLEKCLKTVKPKSINAFGLYLVHILF